MSINFFSGPFAPNHENSIHRKEFPKASWLKGQEKEASQKRSIGRSRKRANSPRVWAVAAGAGGGGEDGRARKGVDKWSICEEDVVDGDNHKNLCAPFLRAADRPQKDVMDDRDRAQEPHGLKPGH